MESMWNQFRFKNTDWWHNGHWFNCNDNIHVVFLKCLFELWFNVKIINPYKHVFFQILLMHIYIGCFDPESDYG